MVQPCHYQTNYPFFFLYARRKLLRERSIDQEREVKDLSKKEALKRMP